MAQPSIPLSFTIHLNDADRGIDTTLRLRTARHPSETAERVWLRVLAFCWQWREGLEMVGELCQPEEPDMIAQGASGEVVAWAVVGKPDEERLRRLVNRHGAAAGAALFESPARLRELVAAAAGARWLPRMELAAVEPALLAALAQHSGRSTSLELVIAGDHFYASLDGQSLDGALIR